MKIKDMKIGELYLTKPGMKFMHDKISSFEDHVYIKKDNHLINRSGQPSNHPSNLDYVTIAYGYYSHEVKKPLVYLGYTMENWWLPRADWFPIRKRHWCIYKGRKMILDAWAAKHIVNLGEYSG